ncbi:exported hypothetical protein [Nostocoides australiense Ben110]|uniref:Uncharacterized protein n=1 Tax=Nostocoides australiense Ben110 TaxID=1193182 RepID=W6JWA0_9MICO|nr:exported hypothetical protein [Tetrasphaera australiensis Ben110]
MALARRRPSHVLLALLGAALAITLVDMASGGSAAYPPALADLLAVSAVALLIANAVLAKEGEQS